MHSVEELFIDERFEAVLFFMKEQGLSDFASLNKFNLDELYLVPGISIEIADEAKILIETFKESIELVTNIGKKCDFSTALQSVPKIIDVEVTSNIGNQENEIIRNSNEGVQNKETDKITGDKIFDEIYSGVSRFKCAVFWSDDNGKTFLDQLTNDISECVWAIYNLGLDRDSVHMLKKIFMNLQHESIVTDKNGINIFLIADSIDSLKQIKISEIFANEPQGCILIRYLQANGIRTISDMSRFSLDIKKIYGIDDINLMRLRDIYYSAIRKYSEMTYIGPEQFTDIPRINRGLPILYRDLNDQGYNYVDDICKGGLSLIHYEKIIDKIDEYRKPINKLFVEKIEAFGGFYFTCLKGRSEYKTLQEIADDVGLTRERVRQISNKAFHKLAPFVKDIVDAMLFPDGSSFYYSDLESVFCDSTYSNICIYAIKEVAFALNIICLDFAEKFIRSKISEFEYLAALHNFADDIIGNGFKLFENLENIEEQLSKYDLNDINIDDLMKYLVKNGYRIYGEYIVPRNYSYSKICRDVIATHFKNGIKLNYIGDSDDITDLRQIISKEYHGLVLPDNNRALVGRLIDSLVLSGRGQYIAFENIDYSPALLTEVFHFINNTTQSSFYYNEIFSHFKGRFLAETNITNSHFLHGLLKYIYPYDFTYERDMLVKNGAHRTNIDERICDLIISKGMPVTKAEIYAEIPGVSDYVIAFVIARNPELIQWDYNVFNHIDNIKITKNEINELKDIVYRESAYYGGYLSEDLIYKAIEGVMPLFILRNRINNSANMFYVISYFLESEYRCSRPHILSRDLPVGDINVINIAKVLLKCETGFNYVEYIHLAEKYGWSYGILNSALPKLEKDYVRISENEYVNRNDFAIEKKILDTFQYIILNYIRESGYYAISSIFNYSDFPRCNYEWSGFLAESVILTYDIGYKIISPQIKDRRLQRGIIILADLPIDSLEQLVVWVMKKDGLTKLSEAEMKNYLINKGLVSKTIPQDIYDSSVISFKNEVFTIL